EEYFSAYARSTAPIRPAPRTGRACTFNRRAPHATTPREFSPKAACHPVGLSFQERTKTRLRTTTTQIPVNSWRRPDRIPTIFSVPRVSRIAFGKVRRFGAGERFGAFRITPLATSSTSPGAPARHAGNRPRGAGGG